MQIDIVFFPRVRRPAPLDMLILLAALVVLGGAAWSAFDKYLTVQSLQKSISASTSRTDNRSPFIASKGVNEINLAIMQLNLPWSDFLSAIEQNISSNIALLGVDPSAERQIVRIEGEAKTAEDMIDFVEQLGRDPFFQGANLLRHQINESDRNHPYQFTIEISWR